MQSQHNYSLFSNIKWSMALKFREYPKFTIASLIIKVLDETQNLLRAFIFGFLIEWIAKNQGVTNVSYILPVSVFGAYILIINVKNVIANVIRNNFGTQIGRFLPKRLQISKLERISVSNLENPTVQNVLQRYEENLHAIRSFTNSLEETITISISAILSIVSTFTITPFITIALLIVSIPDILLNKKYITELHKLDKYFTITSRRSGYLFGTLTNPEQTKEIKLLGAYKYISSFYLKYIDDFWKRYISIYINWSYSDGFSNLLYSLIIIYGTYLALEQALSGQLAISMFSVYVSAIWSLSGDMGRIASYYSSLIGQKLSLDEFRSFLDIEEVSNSGKNIGDTANGICIEFKNVSFKYPETSTYVLKDLSFTINKNEKISIVGENGSGKTTIIKLLSKIYPVTEGEILVNGENINNISAEHLYNALSVLNQDYNTYNDLSLLENIAIGNISKWEGQIKYSDDGKQVDWDADLPELKNIQNALQLADASGFTSDYKHNLATIMSERYEEGIRPSGGQWQKIAIARFFYRDNHMLILDEPTSAIDAQAEARIFENIFEFIQNKTVIIISHKFSTVRKADKIFVLENGRITEEGTHQELLNNNKLYSKMFQTQADGYK